MDLNGIAGFFGFESIGQLVADEQTQLFVGMYLILFVLLLLVFNLLKDEERREEQAAGSEEEDDGFPEEEVFSEQDTDEDRFEPEMDEQEPSEASDRQPVAAIEPEDQNVDGEELSKVFPSDEPKADASLQADEMPPPQEIGPPGELLEESLFTRLKQGLASTRKGFVKKVEDLLKGKRRIDQNLLDELEEVLISADIGVRAVKTLLEKINQKADRNEAAGKIKDILVSEIESILSKQKSEYSLAGKPHVIMMVGVNGTGKTTTLAKLAALYKNEGKRVLVGAGDTFRAAAIEQLETWCDRVGVEIVKHREGADPSAVIYDTLTRGKANDFDVVVLDTAGRLHTKKNLMEEIKKMRKTCEKVLPSAPHEVLLVLDATTGQNAIVQAKEFSLATQVTDIVLTKLDGTAKGGVIIGIVDELQIPVKYIGIGEKMNDLKPFDSQAFTEALFCE